MTGTWQGGVKRALRVHWLLSAYIPYRRCSYNTAKAMMRVGHMMHGVAPEFDTPTLEKQMVGALWSEARRAVTGAALGRGTHGLHGAHDHAWVYGLAL